MFNRISLAFSNKFRRIFLLTSFILLIASCNSTPGFLGGDVLPMDDFRSVQTDTSFALSAYTLTNDTLWGGKLEDVTLGSIYDPIFGRTQASFFTQVGLGSLRHDFGTSQTIDSVFLTLALHSYYGDNSQPITVSVHELTDSLVLGQRYNSLSADAFKYDPEPIGSVVYQGEPLLKIPISNEWAKKITALDTIYHTSQTKFLQQLYGVFVTTSQLDGHGKALYYFDLFNTYATINIYYRNQADENRAFTLLLNNLLVRKEGTTERTTRGANFYVHDYSARSPELGIKNLDNYQPDSVVYVQGLGGARTLLRLDDFIRWAEKMPISINRAELRIELDDNPEIPKDSLVPRLIAYFKVPNGYNYIPDYNADANQDKMDGRYYKARGYYSMNITSYLQQLLSGDVIYNELYIEPAAYLRANRAILRSPSNSQPMKLIITYTKL